MAAPICQSDSLLLPDAKEVEIDDIGRLPESFDMALDTLLNRRYKDYYARSIRKRESTETEVSRDQLYRDRIYTMESAIPLTYNAIVSDAIELYVNRRSTLLSNMLTKATYYFPIIEDELDRQGLPLELKYLAIVESALNPTAVSRAGATGLWQFMLRTAKVYGLQIDSLIDERRDPYKSTAAMCRYFKDMYGLYGDWMLAIAAYNCGPGNVNKAIRRAGGSTDDFWKIYPYLPRETRSYVPFYIAAFYAMEYHEQHGIRPNTIQVPLAVDTIHVSSRQSFETLSQLTSVSEPEIELLNPKYRRKIVPGNNATQVVVLPAPAAIYFSAHKDSILAANEAVHLAMNKKTITHIVERGESMSKIAERYGVDVENIKQWNGLSRTSLRNGQQLKIHLVNGVPDKDAPVKPVTKSATSQEELATRYYTVKRGDTLSGIAAKYRGATVSKIRNANGIRGNMIRPGQKLVIPY
ncbi:MAG: LysM peptidoglycan-binding domain-containing protein [Porphyromonas sp.]|nr:LysM peptidoglycan-binding domain-containing protein [Porphyromonas sp.]